MKLPYHHRNLNLPPLEDDMMTTILIDVPCNVLVSLVTGLKDMLDFYSGNKHYSIEDELTIETARERLSVYEQWAKNKVKGGEE